MATKSVILPSTSQLSLVLKIVDGVEMVFVSPTFQKLPKHVHKIVELVGTKYVILHLEKMRQLVPKIVEGVVIQFARQTLEKPPEPAHKIVEHVVTEFVLILRLHQTVGWIVKVVEIQDARASSARMSQPVPLTVEPAGTISVTPAKMFLAAPKTVEDVVMVNAKQDSMKLL